MPERLFFTTSLTILLATTWIRSGSNSRPSSRSRTHCTPWKYFSRSSRRKRTAHWACDPAKNLELFSRPRPVAMWMVSASSLLITVWCERRPDCVLTGDSSNSSRYSGRCIRRS
uniref:Secreted protein n=1 Tax=Ixodes ricinus TaxID=34613 RepID=A0A6B0UKF0_IXORI